MKAGEIYLAMFPFGDAPGMKLRPVLALTGELGLVPEILVAYVSSVVPAKLLPTDVLIDPTRAEHQSASLKVMSILRLHKLATIHTRSLARHLGTLPIALMSEVPQKLKALLQL